MRGAMSCECECECEGEGKRPREADIDSAIICRLDLDDGALFGEKN